MKVFRRSEKMSKEDQLVARQKKCEKKINKRLLSLFKMMFPDLDETALNQQVRTMKNKLGTELDPDSKEKKEVTDLLNAAASDVDSKANKSYNPYKKHTMRKYANAIREITALMREHAKLYEDIANLNINEAAQEKEYNLQNAGVPEIVGQIQDFIKQYGTNKPRLVDKDAFNSMLNKLQPIMDIIRTNRDDLNSDPQIEYLSRTLIDFIITLQDGNKFDVDLDYKYSLQDKFFAEEGEVAKVRDIQEMISSKAFTDIENKPPNDLMKKQEWLNEVKYYGYQELIELLKAGLDVIDPGAVEALNRQKEDELRIEIQQDIENENENENEDEMENERVELVSEEDEETDQDPDLGPEAEVEAVAEPEAEPEPEANLEGSQILNQSNSPNASASNPLTFSRRESNVEGNLRDSASYQAAVSAGKEGGGPAQRYLNAVNKGEKGDDGKPRERPKKS